MVWGENFSVRVAPGEIVFIDFFVEEDRDYRFESGIPLEDGQWQQLETAALELLPGLTLLNHLEELIFRHNGNSQFSCLALLGTGIFTDHNEACLLRHGAGGFAAEKLDLFRCFIPCEFTQRTGQNENLTSKAGIRNNTVALKIHSRFPQTFDHVPGLGLGKPMSNMAGGNAAHIGNIRQLFLGGVHQRIQGDDGVFAL